MKFSILVALVGFSIARAAAADAARNDVPVYLSSAASSAERLATAELIDRLNAGFPQESWQATDAAPARGRAIFVLNSGRDAALLQRLAPSVRLDTPESFAVLHRRKADFDFAIVAGADSRGVAHAVYALLEKLGWGFYLSTESAPPPRPGPADFASWECADAPLFPDRIALNWHNFLSSATTWEFADWRRYIDAIVRLGFNDLMVHAYGNNPMFTFTFNGVAKPVGYFATTQHGRDWGTQHVNDVRRMIGGDVFSGPVFGASVAQVPDERRVEAATELMQQVFRYARSRGLEVTFALDVDTLSANPQEIIRTLPASARFTVDGVELVNPDTDEGSAYYRAQCDQLLARYPEITRLAVWFRSPDSPTPWRKIKRADLPPEWRREFAGGDDDASAFALARVVHAFQRILRASNRTDVKLAAGSWAFPFLEASDRYLAPDIPLIALDWWVSFDGARARRDLLHVQPGRKVIPILWAHHDDRTYIGRPYTPFVDLATKLERVRAAGFGVLHWTTRPLDLYFKNTIAQTWSASRDQPLEITCDETAARLFGEAARDLGGRYLFAWVTDAPMFGRETTAHFIDHPLPTPELHAHLGRERLELLERIDPATLAPAGAAQLRYFKNYERFMLSFFACQTAVDAAATAVKHGDYAGARTALANVDPVAVIERYVAAARALPITRGEEAILVSLNLRWLPHVLSVRQAAGLEPVRYRVGDVLEEPLAQGAYPNTFYFDADRRLWKTLDRASLPPVLRLGAISGEKLAPGRYTVSGLGEVKTIDGRVEFPASAVRGDEIVITPINTTAGQH